MATFQKHESFYSPDIIAFWFFIYYSIAICSGCLGSSFNFYHFPSLDFLEENFFTVWTLDSASVTNSKSFYLHWHKACDHQTYQSGNLWSRAFIDKVILPIKRVHVRSWNKLKISLQLQCLRPLNMLVVWLTKGLPPIKSHNPLVPCYISSRWQCLGPPNLTWWHIWAPTHEVTWSFNDVFLWIWQIK